ncbi:hypothetical protein CSC70_11845 [Pseudoxanthomonas kalamensis DSM 18571]|uniref:hypothetical protein n=1 Tax=Pseudoxanthomonas kalamensis TaxID=289483 RepID=UPI0013912C6F|nr:hypothetical protein [Pseudoxanthomonas kalamensis]KAF1708797.1 hypothetical protein CSC70_11845 [Pseudoxanthomonas kalamensis DSM 18571]
MTSDIDNERFDGRIRQLHADALANLSPQTLARLRTARQQAGVPTRRRHGWRWFAAAAFPALLAVAIGVQFLPSAPTPQTGTTVATETDGYTGPLDENPDLYLWLASDPSLMAVE